MSTISGNFYKVTYVIVTNGVNTDPPAIVGAIQFALVNAATAAAAITALTTDLSISGSLRLVVMNVQQVDSQYTVYN